MYKVGEEGQCVPLVVRECFTNNMRDALTASTRKLARAVQERSPAISNNTVACFVEPVLSYMQTAVAKLS